MTHLLTNWIQSLGYLGVFFAMALESACIPLPSEIIMPFGGYLVWSGQLHLWGVVLAGTLGNVAGSLAAYYVGLYGGRAAIERYGRYVHLSRRHVEQAERWFAKRGPVSVLIGRVLPVVRTFISLPAGMARMPVGKFMLYSFIGSLPWVYLLTWAGVVLGREWEYTGHYTHPFTYGVAGAIVICAFVLLIRRRKTRPAKAE
ncbi:DedA family protein [Alicyclobacillus macrosporangiidus]|uniref:DedA family protein n=1 Tax=Alicyclobacillus macrosporangiidus TaxID=392015 RepID=UPI001E39B26A|nr:DedA family protein [Alicyclobacillus macrosporangiidus]